MTAWVAATAVGVVVWLWVPGSRGARPPHRVRPAEGRRRWTGTAPAAAGAVCAGGLLVLLDGTTLALGLIAVGMSAAAWQAVLRARAIRAASRHADSVVEVCEALAGELRAGQPPQVALRRCVEVWPALEPVATASELGADVPRALRQVARQPGATGLTEIAAAWQVSATSGGTMALALSRVADSARRRRAAQHLVATELASARATARLVAVLPIAVLAMGSGLGGDPWAFLLSSPPGLACLAAGLALAYAGMSWIDRISAHAVDAR